MTIREYINKAILENRDITIKYRKYDGSISTRRLSNVEFSDEFGEDYIAAYCHLRNENRTFKISRIIEVDGVKNSSSYTPRTSTPSYSSSSGYSSSSTRSSTSSYHTPSSHSSSRSKSNEGCYIATMAYGDYDHPQVIILRNFRDQALSKSFWGRAFIDLYYSISPKLVSILQGHKLINNRIRLILDKFIVIIQKRY